jgi:transposase
MDGDVVTANLIECGSSWAKNMHNLLMGCYLLDKPPDSIRHTYDDILLLGEQEEPPPAYTKRGRPKQSVGRCLLNRLRKYKEGVLSFAFNKTIPFTNNQAERDIRCVKTKLKVSGGFRSISGLNGYARIQSVISTWREQRQDVFEQLNRVFCNQSIIGG